MVECLGLVNSCNKLEYTWKVGHNSIGTNSQVPTPTSGIRDFVTNWLRVQSLSLPFLSWIFARGRVGLCIGHTTSPMFFFFWGDVLDEKSITNLHVLDAKICKSYSYLT